MKMINRAQMLSCLSVVPQRYLFAFIGFLISLVGGMMHLTLNLTLSRMVNLTSNILCDIPDECLVSYSAGNYSVFDNSSNGKSYSFDWDEDDISNVTGGFFLGYVIAQFFGGMTAVSRGGKGVLGFAFLISSVATILGPIVAKLTGPSGMRIAQMATGLGQGATLPALMVMLSYWSPETERARLGAIVYSGRYIGFAVAIYLSKLILTYRRWDVVYYVFGSIGLFHCAIWYMLCYSTPNTHLFISKKEKIFLNEKIDVVVRREKYKVEPMPWKALLRSSPFWAICAGALGNKLAYHTVIMQLPAFMTDIQNNDNGFSIILPSLPLFLLTISTICFGFICDFGIKLGVHSITKARKFYTMIAAVVPVICIIIATYSGNKAIVIIFCINISMVSLGAYCSGMMIAPLEVAPNYSGAIFALADTIANNLVRLLPLFVRNVVIDGTLGQWKIILWVCVVVISITTVICIGFINLKQFWWDDVRKFGYPADWKHGFFPAQGFIDLKMLEDSNETVVKPSPEGP